MAGELTANLLHFLIKSGGAIIDNMGLLFAVGVAFGLSKDKHGSAALSGLVGYYVVTTLLSPGSVAQLQHIDVSEVPAAFGKINNQFIGILIGVISAELYNRFYQVELPKALSFFSGKTSCANRRFFCHDVYQLRIALHLAIYFRRFSVIR